VLAFLVLYSAVCNGQDSKQADHDLKLLFVGNSLTYTNNLPVFVSHISKVKYGLNNSVDMFAFGGASFRQHLDTDIITIVLLQNYDHVIIK
jgi:hypothetical protein